MRRLMWLVFSLTLTKLGSISADENICSEEKFRECFDVVQKALDDHFNGDTIAHGEELNKYCQTMEDKASCLKEGSEACKNEHKEISAITAYLFTYLTQFCIPGTEPQKNFDGLIECSKKHEAEFQKCAIVDKDIKVDKPELKNVCLKVESLMCLAETSTKMCDKDGGSFGKSLKGAIKETFSGICHSGGRIVEKSWLLLLTVSVFLLLRNKFKAL